MIDPGAKRAILAAVDDLAADAEAMLADLVRFPSTLGNEGPCLDHVAGLFAGLGAEVRRIPTDPATLGHHPGFSPPLIPYAGRDNVGAVLAPKRGDGRSLCLQAHVDVVPEGAAELWTAPPFEPVVRQGRMYGRGAGDMKAGLVSNIIALKALARAGLAPSGMVQLQAVIEEECTGNGALATMLAMPKADAVIIPEPGPGVPALYTAEVGVVWAWVTVMGKPAHVREKHAGVNAIEAAMTIAERFRDYENEMNRAERIHAAFRGINHPVNVNLGTVEGGEWNSSVPTRARIGMRVGVMMGYTAAEAKRDIERIVAEAAVDPALKGAKVSLSWGGFMADPCVFDTEAEICQLARKSYAEVTGGSLRDYPATGLTDGRFFTLYQGTPVAVFGPDADAIHGIDESVGLASMHAITKSIALTIAAWCGTEPRA
ncbi:MAG: ArgE/DapE family deacylase [Acetobacteraceae bacterium]|jgi:acetylornithine deacetylase|nr:ArgE/DapE family deacylase [Acetobacteraceae bacterium]